MHIQKIKIKNFRLLADVEMVLEKDTTLIVGRNNSGKTSLSEVIRRFLIETSPTFQIEDFSIATYDRFCAALQAKNSGKEDDEIRSLLPSIEIKFLFSYEPIQHELGLLSDFIIDLDASCNEALAVACYELREGGIKAFFEGQPQDDLTDISRQAFFKVLRERIPTMFNLNVWAEDPNDSANRKKMSQSALRLLLKTGFINAQRGLDDTTTRETDILARTLEGLFASAMSPNAEVEDQLIAQSLQEAVKDIQQKLDDDFNIKLQDLIPTLETFGYPGLSGQDIATETTLDVKRLLSNNTKIRYTGYCGISLPESYNGLGIRNLIFILLQVVSFYKAFRAEPTSPCVNLVFIEEPEAHLHPQMQEVFIRQLSKISQQLSAKDETNLPWPVQFIVSTHSSHIANEVGFETIRYFLSTISTGSTRIHQTKIKDLREGLQSTTQNNKYFLHQYLTLTKCDLFFADKAILIEGTSERLLLPMMIKKLEADKPLDPKLSSQYISTIEVGGAYAHLFFELLNFLELYTLIVTDIDTVTGPSGTACTVHEGTYTSNACIKEWFLYDCISPITLLRKKDSEKIKASMRIAFQRPESEDGPCGRTFEDAFMIANPQLFEIQGSTAIEKEQNAFAKAKEIKKTQFALKYALEEADWTTPGYILDGLKWLASRITPVLDVIKEPVVNTNTTKCKTLANTDE